MLRPVTESESEDRSESVALFQASRAGEENALGELVVRYLPDIRAFVRMQIAAPLRALEAETDVVQSVCREILARPDRVEFRGDREFRSWLFCAVLNKLRDKVRHHHAQRRDVRRELPVPTDEALLSGYASLVTPSRAAVAREEVARIEAACERLNERQRAVLAMARIAGMSHADIARALDCTEVASRQLLNRALARLSVELERGR